MDRHRRRHRSGPKLLAGKVLRLHDDGSVPKDNPFVGKQGYRPEIYTLGHRSSMGLTIHPGTGEVWLSEMGPNGGDEINVLKPGRNYGWPLVSLGRTYPGPWQAKVNEPSHAGFEPPVIYWMPSISVSGLTFYTGDKLPKWKGDLFVRRAALRRDSGHRPTRSHSLQREDGRAAPRDRCWSTCTSGSGT